MENTRIKKRRRPKTLTQEERMEVVKRHYLEGRSQASLSREYGVAESVVSRIISNFAAENDKSALFMKKDAKTRRIAGTGTLIKLDDKWNRGIQNRGNLNGYLRDTCLTAQDHYKALLDYFKIKY